MFGNKFGFRGTFMMEKMLNGICKCGFGWLQYQLESISHIGFGFQNSGFSHTKIFNSIGLILHIVEPVDTSISQNWCRSGIHNYRFETP